MSVPSVPSRSAVRLQPLTRARVQSLGAAGADWLAELPAVLDDLTRRWSLTLGRPLPGGSASYVVGARTRDGTEVVVKIAAPDPGFEAQVRALDRAGGRGYVRLLASAPELRAVLLERLGPSLAGSGLTPEDQLIRIADTLAEAWQPPGVLAQVDKAGALQRSVDTAWKRQGRPCSARVIERALECADRRGADRAAELVVVHGDAHPGNLLAVGSPRPGAASGWCFVDPDGFVADRAYDLGVALRDWSGRLLAAADPRGQAERYCRVLADRSGVDPTRIWEWGFLERVATGLYVLDVVGAPAVARPFLDSAELLLV